MSTDGNSWNGKYSNEHATLISMGLLFKASFNLTSYSYYIAKLVYFQRCVII